MIDIKDLCKYYLVGDERVRALDHATLHVYPGEFVSIIGPSGCGKSTLLSLIAGLETPSAGTVELDGEPVTGTSSKIGFMPQRDQLFAWRSIWGNVTLGLELSHQNTPGRQAHVRALLDRYGLSGFADKQPAQLSGGMRQRCALIRTLATEPKILLLDEPFSALDHQTRLSVSADIHRIIRQERKTTLLVTHDIPEAISLSDRVLVLTARPGRLRSIHTPDGLGGLSPMERRNHPHFLRYFNDLWKELDVHV